MHLQLKVYRPKIVKEAMTDLDEIVVVIKAMQNM